MFLQKIFYPIIIYKVLTKYCAFRKTCIFVFLTTILIACHLLWFSSFDSSTNIKYILVTYRVYLKYPNQSHKNHNGNKFYLRIISSYDLKVEIRFWTDNYRRFSEGTYLSAINPLKYDLVLSLLLVCYLVHWSVLGPKLLVVFIFCAVI